MLFSGSTFSGSGFSAGGGMPGGDPRTLIAVILPASGGAVFGMSAEFGPVIDIPILGGLDSPLVRIRRTVCSMPGVWSFAADVSVSPVMVTLDGNGGMVAALGYVQARVRARLAADGGMNADMDAGRSLRSRLAAGGGMGAQVFEYHKARAVFEGEVKVGVFGGRWTTLEAILAAAGGMTADTAYDLFGPVITVTARAQESVAVTARGSADDILALAAEHEDIIVVSEGI